MKTLISYIRFSTMKQGAVGRLSERRQIDRAKAYAEQNGYRFDELTTLKDLGFSGYGLKENQRPALSGFLDALEADRVNNPTQTIFCVEDLTRLSRRPPIESIATLNKIVSYGVDVLTLTDGKIYTKANLNELSSLMGAMIHLHAGYDESKRKSDYSNNMWEKRRAEAMTGTKIKTNLPAWLEFSGDKIKVIPARIKTIEKIFKLYTEDKLGSFSITRELNKISTPTFGPSKLWADSTVKMLIKDRRLLGEWKPKNAAEPMINYFPSVIDIDTFNHALTIAKGRTTNGKGAGRHSKEQTNLFTHLTYCDNCGASVFIRSGGGSSQYGTYHYQVCSAGHNHAGCKISKGVRVPWLEKIILWYIKDELKPEDFQSKNAQTNLKQIESTQSQIETLKQQILNLAEAVSSVSGFAQKTFLSKIDKAESQINVLNEELEKLLSIRNNHTEENLAEVQNILASKKYDRKMLKNKISLILDKIYIDFNTKIIKLSFKNTLKASIIFPTGIIEKLGGVDYINRLQVHSERINLKRKFYKEFNLDEVEAVFTVFE